MNRKDLFVIRDLHWTPADAPESFHWKSLSFIHVEKLSDGKLVKNEDSRVRVMKNEHPNKQIMQFLRCGKEIVSKRDPNSFCFFKHRRLLCLPNFSPTVRKKNQTRMDHPDTSSLVPVAFRHDLSMSERQDDKKAEQKTKNVFNYFFMSSTRTWER